MVDTGEVHCARKVRGESGSASSVMCPPATEEEEGDVRNRRRGNGIGDGGGRTHASSGWNFG